MHKPYWLRVLFSVDQLFNVVCGKLFWGPYAGDEDETISSALGKLRREYGGTIPWKYPFPKLIDWFLDKIDPNHSIDAIEDDEGV